jgi:hypothetical protein
METQDGGGHDADREESHKDDIGLDLLQADAFE